MFLLARFAKIEIEISNWFSSFSYIKLWKMLRFFWFFLITLFKHYVITYLKMNIAIQANIWDTCHFLPPPILKMLILPVLTIKLYRVFRNTLKLLNIMPMHWKQTSIKIMYAFPGKYLKHMTFMAPPHQNKCIFQLLSVTNL